MPDTESCGGGHSSAENERCDGSEDAASTVAGTRTRGRCAGVELEKVPLCSVCKVETAGETRDHVLEKGLDTVSKFDEGLSRDRLKMLEEKPGEKETEKTPVMGRWTLTTRRLRGSRASEIERDLKKYIDSASSDSNTRESPARSVIPVMTDGAQSSDDSNYEDEASLLENAAQMPGESDCGFADDSQIEYHNHSDDESAEFGQQQQLPRLGDDRGQDIYVSIFDPIGEPTFRPSKTKPLPNWMRLLPNNVRREREQRERRLVIRSEPVQGTHELDTLRPNTPIAVEVEENLQVDTTKSSTHATAATSLTPPLDPVTLTGIINAASAIPNTRFSFDAADNKITDAAYDNSESVKWIVHAPKPMKTPFPRMAHSTMHRSNNASYSDHSMVIHPVKTYGVPDRGVEERSSTPALSPERTAGQISPKPPLSTQSTANLLPELLTWSRRLESPIGSPRAFSYSSEYLERYQPVAVRGSWYQRYVPKEPEPILDKIRRQRGERGSQRLERGIGVEKKQDRPGERIGESRTEAVLESHVERVGRIEDPRSNLHRELRNLFCEE